jgi:hypothetical protein
MSTMNEELDSVNWANHPFGGTSAGLIKVVLHQRVLH